MDALDVRDEEVEDRARVIMLGTLGRREHEPDPPAIEERELRTGLEEEAKPKRVTIERGGASDVLAHDGDLPDAGLPEGGHGASPSEGGAAGCGGGAAVVS